MRMNPLILKKAHNLSICDIESKSDSSLRKIRLSSRMNRWHPYHCCDRNIIIHNDSYISQSIGTVSIEVNSWGQQFFEDYHIRRSME